MVLVEVVEVVVGKRQNCVDVASSTADRHTRLDLAEKGEPQRWVAPAAEALETVINASEPSVELDHVAPRLVYSGAVKSTRLVLS